MTRVTPFLLFVGDQCGRAEAAVRAYVAAFDDAEILGLEPYGPDEGETGLKQGRFRIGATEFRAMDSGAGHPFTFTPAISLFIDLEDRAALDRAFTELAEDGTVLMPLQAYDFSPRFGWVQDRFGVSWQLNLSS